MATSTSQQILYRLQRGALRAGERDGFAAMWLPRIQGVLPVLVSGWRAVCALPPTSDSSQAIALGGILDTCNLLCTLPGLVGAMEEVGGFQLLADQAAVVFDAVSCSSTA